MLLKILSRRFGAIPETLDADLARIGDVAQLESLADAALGEPSLDAFARSLKSQ